LTSTPKSTKSSRAGRPSLTELTRRKTKIVDIATRLFMENGFAATSLVEVAKKARVATRTIYQHFGDKVDLFQEVIFARDNAPSIDSPYVTEDDTLPKALTRAGLYAYEFSLHPKTVSLMRLMVAERNRFPELIRKVSEASYRRFYENIELVFVKLSEFGRIPGGNHRESARLFVDLILGVAPFFNYLNWGHQAPTAAELKTKVDLFIAGRFGATIQSAQRAHR
jgi:TetR/AcrR family transcriptional regulator, mexJK operon transcriptional repressor